jgi:lipopolysaccharide/colanic/teichoic acid biosynthesis glycosyltransferase
VGIKELSLAQYRWILDIDPDKSILRGQTYLAAKRLMDLALVLAAAPFWLPVTALIALIIWIQSPGAPVIFIQQRTGQGGRRFKMFKFRTMVPDAEALKQTYMHLNELKWPDFKITNDPRITPIGRFLRKTSLDELPQMFNVLKGEMSLVGPRPTSFGAETYRLWQTERLDVQPGVTGLWQIIGRSETEFDERLRLDIAYVERRCLSLDIQILFRTVGTVLSRKGAR